MEIESYGVQERIQPSTEIERAAECIRALGYAVVDSGYTDSQIKEYVEAFERARKTYTNLFGYDLLKSTDEHYTIRCPLGYEARLLEIATNQNIVTLAKILLNNSYIILNQQNGIINPPFGERYNQGFWHRDLPYQHNVFFRPLAINALFCIDDFTYDNGATKVLPSSHKQAAFPSDSFVEKQAVQVTARRGNFIVLDCMTYHSGGTNNTSFERRAINHVISVPFIRQQINLPQFLGSDFTQDRNVRQFLGYFLDTLNSPDEWLQVRLRKFQHTKSTEEF